MRSAFATPLSPAIKFYHTLALLSTANSIFSTANFNKNFLRSRANISDSTICDILWKSMRALTRSQQHAAKFTDKSKKDTPQGLKSRVIYSKIGNSRCKSGREALYHDTTFFYHIIIRCFCRRVRLSAFRFFADKLRGDG